MPAWPISGLVATRWPQSHYWNDYPSFRQHVIQGCLRTGKQVPDDRVLASEYETRVVELTRFRAHCEIKDWEERHRQYADGTP